MEGSTSTSWLSPLYRLDVTSLPLPPSLRAKLLAEGFANVADFQGYSPVDLAKDAGISNKEANHVLKLVQRTRLDGAYESNEGPLAGAKTAFEVLQKEKARKRISTLCDELDGILGGGLAPQEVTEICGVPGIGKTQLGIQLAISVQLPEELGGLAGEAVYIDTEGSFMVERVLEMVDAWLLHVRQLASSSGRPEFAEQMTRESVLSCIYFYRVHDHTEQVAVLNELPSFLKEHPRVRLLVIDSVTFHFRQDFEDMALRTRLLNGMSQKLMSLADKYNLAVALVNQVTTKVLSDNKSKLVPALGESWSHACTNRVICFWTNGQRFAHLYKSPSLPSATAPYFVTREGIRGTAKVLKRGWEGQEDTLGGEPARQVARSS